MVMIFVLYWAVWKLERLNNLPKSDLFKNLNLTTKELFLNKHKTLLMSQAIWKRIKGPTFPAAEAEHKERNTERPGALSPVPSTPHWALLVV